MIKFGVCGVVRSAVDRRWADSFLQSWRGRREERQSGNRNQGANPSQQQVDDIEDEEAVEEFLKKEAAGKVKWIDFDSRRYGAR
jgi:hypothetical protein